MAPSATFLKADHIADSYKTHEGHMAFEKFLIG
jgi:hypothetical protein